MSWSSDRHIKTGKPNPHDGEPGPGNELMLMKLLSSLPPRLRHKIIVVAAAIRMRQFNGLARLQASDPGNEQHRLLVWHTELLGQLRPGVERTHVCKART